MGALHEAVIVFGSNDNQEQNVSNAKSVLTVLFPHITFSSCVWTEPIGVQTDRFLNCMCFFTTTHGKTQVMRALKHAENKLGSTTADRNRNKVTIDIDLMMFDGEKLHLADWNRGYVIQLYDELRKKVK